MIKYNRHMIHETDLLGGTPDKIDTTLDDEYHDIEVEAKPTREELISRYHVRFSHF